MSTQTVSQNRLTAKCTCGHFMPEHAADTDECCHVGSDRVTIDCDCPGFDAGCCISGVCDYHNALNIARVEYSKFVAAARWLRANGWTYDRTDMGSMREWRWIKSNRRISILSHSGRVPFEISVKAGIGRFELHSIGVETAIAVLAAAGILPEQLSPQCTYCEVAS